MTQVLLHKVAALHRRMLDRFLTEHVALYTLEQRRQARVAVGLLLYGFLSCLAMAVTRYLTKGWAPPTVIVTAASPFLLCGLVVLARTGKVGLAIDVFMMAVVAVIFATAFTDGGLTSRVLTWLPAMPLVASFGGGRLGPFRICVLGGCGLGLVLWVQQMEWFEAYFVDDSPVGRALAVLASMVFVAAVSVIYEDTRRRAEQERAALDKTRNEWVSVVSHELRTPMTSMHGALKLLYSGALDAQPDQRRHMLGVALKGGERLIHLVNDILDVEKLSAGQLKLNREPFELRRAVDEAVEAQQFLARSNDIELAVHAGQEPLKVIADQKRIVQVLQNLLSNAIKFSPPGERVEIEIRDQGKAVVCEVRDRGPGVSEQFRPQLFQRFSQENSGSDRSAGGSGLGLYISRAIVEQHRGELGYRNRPGGGSLFFFTLPKT